MQNVLKDHPEITLETIEVTTNIKQTWNAGIRMFPALKIGDDILSGVLLSEDKIRTFVEQHVK
ncbi:MAG: hypothetical protein BA874_11220 [Desulfuromonadales bacterium C00003068]|nr:MAG: hypothetical protein BA874_11220 [Desulfuromonadales bacterium C00003068]